MKTLRFQTAIMVLTPVSAVSIFRDGLINSMPLGTKDHEAFSAAAGYGQDGRRYIIEHDAIHHLLADRRRRPWSDALHSNAQIALDLAPHAIQEEEHLVQRTQRLLNLGQPDPHGQLDLLFGRGLVDWIERVRQFLDSELGPLDRAFRRHPGDDTAAP